MSADDGWSDDWAGPTVTDEQRHLLGESVRFVRRVAADLLGATGRHGDARRVDVDAEALEQDLHDELSDGLAGQMASRDTVWAAQQLLLAAGSLERIAAGTAGIGHADTVVLDVATALEVASRSGAVPARAVLARDYVDGSDPLASLVRAAEASERLA